MNGAIYHRIFCVMYYRVLNTQVDLQALYELLGAQYSQPLPHSINVLAWKFLSLLLQPIYTANNIQGFHQHSIYALCTYCKRIEMLH